MLDNATLKKYYLNHNVDFDTIDKTIRDFDNTLYTQCLQNQKLECRILRFNGKFSEFKIDRKINSRFKLPSGTLTYYIEEDIINYFKKRGYPQTKIRKPITLRDIANDAMTFERMGMFFIDGYLFFNIIIIPNDFTTIIAIPQMTDDGLTKAQVRDFTQRDVDWSLVLHHHSAIGDTTRTRQKFFQYSDYVLGRYFDMHTYKLEDMNATWDIYTSVNTDMGNLMLGTSGTLKTVSGEKRVQYSPFFRDRMFNRSGLVNVNSLIINNRHYGGDMILQPNDRWFMIPLKKNPVPTHNIFIWKYDPSSTLRKYIHNAKIKHHFPNVYEIDMPDHLDDTIFVEWFYEENTHEIDTFINPLGIYTDSVDLLELYKTDTIPDALRNFDPINFVFNEKNYLNTGDFPDDFKYRIDKLNEMIREQYKYYKYYCEDVLFDQYHPRWKIDINKIPNFFSRTCTTTRGLLKIESNLADFDEEYVYVINTNAKVIKHNSVIIYIDGIRYVPKHIFLENALEYIFLPKRLITGNSILFIEMYNDTDDFRIEYDFRTINGDMKAPAHLPRINTYDIIYYDADTYRYFLNNRRITYTYDHPKVGIITSDQPFFKQVDPLRLSMRYDDDYMTGKRVIMESAKQHRYKEIPVDEIMSFGIYQAFGDFSLQADLDRFRVSVDGRYLDRGTFYPILPLYAGDPVNLAVSLNEYLLNPPFNVLIEYLPYKYREVYRARTIPTNGVINLTGKIDRPFSLKYYDVFLNGRRLTSENIYIATANWIQIKNVKSIQNLVIVEKNCDYDWDRVFDWGGYSPLDDLIPEIEDEIFDDEEIPDEEIPTTPLIPIEVLIALLFYEDYLLINRIYPDINQVNDDIQFQYQILFEQYGEVFRVNPDVVIEAVELIDTPIVTVTCDTVYHYNPDNQYEEEEYLPRYLTQEPVLSIINPPDEGFTEFMFRIELTTTNVVGNVSISLYEKFVNEELYRIDIDKDIEPSNFIQITMPLMEIQRLSGSYRFNLVMTDRDDPDIRINYTRVFQVRFDKEN